MAITGRFDGVTMDGPAGTTMVTWFGAIDVDTVDG